MTYDAWQRPEETAGLSLLLFLFLFGGLLRIVQPPHLLLDPFVIWVGAHRFWPSLHRKQNCFDVAITIWFLLGVTDDVCLLSNVFDVAEAAVPVRALCETQVDAGEEQNQDKSVKLHGCCCSCWCSSCCCCCSWCVVHCTNTRRQRAKSNWKLELDSITPTAL